MGAKNGAAAVEFEIEVACIRFGLRKELDATIFPNRIEVIGPFAKDVPVFNAKQAVNPRFIVQQPRRRPRPVWTALRTKMSDFEGSCAGPFWAGPIAGKTHR